MTTLKGCVETPVFPGCLGLRLPLPSAVSSRLVLGRTAPVHPAHLRSVRFGMATVLGHYNVRRDSDGKVAIQKTRPLAWRVGRLAIRFLGAVPSRNNILACGTPHTHKHSTISPNVAISNRRA